MTQEQKIKEFVDKWVGKHGFAGIFHNYRKDCIQDLTNLLDNWIKVEDELPKEGKLINIAVSQDVTSGIYGGDKLWINKKTSKIIKQKDITHWQPLPQPPKE